MMSSNGAMSAEFDFKAAFHREHADLCKVESRNYVLKQRIEALETALRDAAQWFQGYADGHLAKGDTDKAKRNQDRADACRKALVEE